MKFFRSVLIVAVILFALLVVLLWTPDTSREQMTSLYANSASSFLELPGGDRIHYRDQGQRVGQTLLLIHGTSASLHTWEPLVAELKEQFRLVSLDLPGHGLTGANQARDYSSAAMSRAIWAVMDHLQIDTAVLVGNSLGGRVAWHSALRSPDRVSALVLLASSGAPRTTEAKSNIGFKLLGTSMGQAVMKKITPRFIIDQSLQQTVFDPSLVDADMVDRYWQLLRMKGNRQAMIDLARQPRDAEKWRQLSDLAIPTLVIWGVEDGVLPIAMADTFERELPQVTMSRLEKVGHLPMEEAVLQVSEQISLFCQGSSC